MRMYTICKVHIMYIFMRYNPSICFMSQSVVLIS